MAWLPWHGREKLILVALAHRPLLHGAGRAHVGKVSPFRSLCCVGSIPARAASLDDRELRRTPSWSGREPTPERSMGGQNEAGREWLGGSITPQTNGRPLRHDPFEHLGAHVPLVFRH
jgi:hypothetical protein